TVDVRVHAQHAQVAVGSRRGRRDHPHRRRLARPVRAQETERLAPFDVHVDPAYRLELAEALDQCLGLHHRGRRLAAHPPNIHPENIATTHRQETTTFDAARALSAAPPAPFPTLTRAHRPTHDARWPPFANERAATGGEMFSCCRTRASVRARPIPGSRNRAPS